MQAFHAGDLAGAMRRVDALLPAHSDRHDVLTAKGVLLVADGRRQEGLEALAHSLELQGNQPEALSWAAHAALSLEQFPRAEELSRRFVKLQPLNPRGHHLLARALVGGGRLEEALGAIERALELNPNDREGLALAAQAAIGLEAFHQAETYARRLVSIDPDGAQGHFLLALALDRLGQTLDALESVERSLAVRPDDVDALLLQARLLKAMTMTNLASGVYRRVLELRMHPGATVTLAQLLLQESRPAEALAILERALPAIPEPLRPYDLIAQAKTELFQLEEAEVAWTLAKTHASDPIELAQRRAMAEIAVGRFELAESILRELIDSGTGEARSFHLLTTARKMQPDDSALIERMESLLHSGVRSTVEQVQVHFALGKTFDDLKDYERAIGHFDEANRLNYSLYLANTPNPQTPENVRAHSEARLRFFVEAGSAGNPNPSDAPILVMGMPRSGTTLTASILSAHSKVGGGSETPFWRERSVLFEKWTAEGMSLNWELAERFAEEYVRMLSPRQPGIEHMVDKTPANYFNAALLHRLLPNVKMVHLLRHPVDNLLSIWMNLFDDAGSFSSNRTNLVVVYREHLRNLRRLEELLPADRFRVLGYERLTSEPVQTIGALLDFFGLDHEPACFEPEKNVRTIKTLSVAQARQPINTASQQRWKNYEPWLGEFAELLDEP